MPQVTATLKCSVVLQNLGKEQVSTSCIRRGFSKQNATSKSVTLLCFKASRFEQHLEHPLQHGLGPASKDQSRDLI